MENLKREVGYCCKCGKIISSVGGMYKHGKKCSVYISEERDFKKKLKVENEEVENETCDGKIKCKLCNHWGHSLTGHIKNKHNMTKKEYGDQTLSSAAYKNYSRQNRKNGKNSAQKACYRRGESIEDYYRRVGKIINKSLMNNEKERIRRSKLLTKLNKRSDFKKKASITAIKTSSRRNIQLQRAERLRKWRKENIDIFYNKCVKQMHKYKSKPEKDLYQFLKSNCAKFNFSNNQQIKNSIFVSNKTKRKQIDIISEDKKVIIEFDGCYHFRDIRKNGSLEIVQRKDRELDTYAVLKNILLIRVSHDQYDYRRGGFFKQRSLDKILEILYNNSSGVFKIGEEYGENNIL